MTARRFFAAVALALIALPATSTGGGASSVHRVAAVRAGLPASRLEFGLSNLDVSWMTSSGVPWRYRFQYLSAGVNTGQGWETWQDPALPPGQFALDFMNSSTAAPANYIPVFTYYELLQSSPSSGSSELDRDFNNLNNASTMAAYYGNFQLLMQRAGTYGKAVVIHVEPDFWGYMQQKAAGGAAATITAKVKGSGFPTAAAYPDNLVGFASELKYLRDSYAPNVMLAMHASMWSSSIDIASDTRSTIDGAAEADKTAAFLNSAGAGSWDAVFNDVDDHNAAWWELASCGTPPCVSQYFTHWWDANNVRFPNFMRYLTWVGELHARTALPQVVWQVPMGNQYFLTMNNTCGHYQDNVAPYFIAHASDLFASGLVAVLFGPGNSCQTSYSDDRNDGVTNNGGAATTDVLGGCSACNTQTSAWADDDGGYLRIFVGRYYAGLLPCGSVTASAAPPAPQSAGMQIAITGAATGCTNPRYQFWMLSPGSQTWQRVQQYSPSTTFSWDTSKSLSGSYTFSIWAEDASSGGLAANTLGRWDSYTTLTYNLTATACTLVSASSSPPSTALSGTPVTITAAATGCPNPRYEFWVLPPGSSTWQIAQPYGISSALSWSTVAKPAGLYRFSIWARDAASAGTAGNALGRWDTYVAQAYSLTSSPCTSVSTIASAVGTTVTITATAAGCPHPQYAFWILYPGSSTWQLAQEYSDTATFPWSTASSPRGTYHFSVWARDTSSTGTAGNVLGRWDAYAASVYVLA